MAASADGKIYEHEFGYLAAGQSRVGEVRAESAPMDIGMGENLLEADQLLTDEDDQAANLDYKFDLAYTPNGPIHTAGPYSLTRNDGYTDVRFTGRQAAMTVSLAQDGDFRLGTPRLRVQKGSRR